MKKGTEDGKKMPVVIELNELDDVSGGLAAIPVKTLTPTLLANRCPPAQTIAFRPTIVIRPGELKIK